MNDDEDFIDNDKPVWLQRPHSRTYLLLKMQKAFCARQFTNAGADSNIEEALRVLLKMDPKSGYAQMIGFQLANSMATAASG